MDAAAARSTLFPYTTLFRSLIDSPGGNLRKPAVDFTVEGWRRVMERTFPRQRRETPSSPGSAASDRRCLDIVCSGGRFGYRVSVFAHGFQVHLDCAAHKFRGFLEGETARNTAGQVRRVRTISRRCFFVDDQVSSLQSRLFQDTFECLWPSIHRRMARILANRSPTPPTSCGS